MAFEKGEDSEQAKRHAELMREIKDKKKEMRENQRGGKNAN